MSFTRNVAGFRVIGPLKGFGLSISPVMNLAKKVMMSF